MGYQLVPQAPRYLTTKIPIWPDLVLRSGGQDFAVANVNSCYSSYQRKRGEGKEYKDTENDRSRSIAALKAYRSIMWPSSRAGEAHAARRECNRPAYAGST